ncbi:MAG: homocysteine S-methyltransferase family protein [Candidatus Dojkabacteria bacterium]
MKDIKNKIITLDGGTGRELEAQGASIDPPLWSANALIDDPNVVKNVHKLFIDAGSEVITTNTYAVTRYNLGNAGMAKAQGELLDIAYEQARLAKQEADNDVRIAASIPPLTETYRADLVLGEEDLKDEYEFLIGKSIANNVDILLAETLSDAKEARIIVELVETIKAAPPLWISFTVNEQGDLRSGESLSEIAKELVAKGVNVVLVNCSTMQNINRSMEILGELSKKIDFQFGAYGNRYNEIRKDYKLELKSTELKEDLCPADYTESVKYWIQQGATIVGGCCGIGPEYIRDLLENIG